MGHGADELMQPAGRIQSETLRRDSVSHSHLAVIRVYDHVVNGIETYEHAGEFNVMLTYAWAPQLAPRSVRRAISPLLCSLGIRGL